MPEDEIPESRSRLRKPKNTDCGQFGEAQPEDLAALSKARITATVSRIAQLSLMPWLDHNSDTVHSNPHFQLMFAYVLEHSTKKCWQTFKEEAILRLGFILVATCLITENDQIEVLPLDGWISMYEDRLEQVEDWNSIETQTSSKKL
ncbi:Vacuolar protein 8 [Ascosphaera pollenicola]|nr:Vacuolar protein 8 [Ascosphaera pollenicola]